MADTPISDAMWLGQNIGAIRAVFSGGASGNASTLEGQPGSYYLAAENLTGTVASARLPAISFASLTGKPTTIAGYGITDAVTTFAQLGGKPTTLAGYGITDAQSVTGSVSWARVNERPTTLAGYGIGDAQPLDSDLMAIAGLVTTSFGRDLLTKADDVAVRSSVNAAKSGANTDITSITGSAARLTTARAINGQTFDGTAAITVTANWSAPRTLSFTGDASGSLSTDGSANTSTGLTLATVNPNVGTFGSATTVPVVTVDGKGRVTAVTTATITGGGGGGGGDMFKADNLSGLANNDTALANLGGGTGTGGGRAAFKAADAAAVRSVIGAGTGNGTVTSFAFTNGNGFTATVGNAGTTPTLSLTYNGDAGTLGGNSPSYYTNSSNQSTGTLPAARLPAFTGDIITTAGSAATTLANSGVTANTYGSTIALPVLTVNAKGLLTNVTTVALGTAAVQNVGTSAGNVPQLDSGGKLLTAVLPEAILGAMKYQGTWDASTNSPTLASPPASSTKGFYYVVSVAGSTNLSGITDWKVGDWAVSNGSTWDKVDSSDQVASVAGLMGAITAANLLTALGASTAALGALTPAADRVPYFTSGTAAAVTTLTTYGRSLIAFADAAALTAQINVATTAAKGAVPALPGNTTTYFRGDGTFATLPAAATLLEETANFSTSEPFKIVRSTLGGTFAVYFNRFGNDGTLRIDKSDANGSTNLTTVTATAANASTTSVTLAAGQIMQLSWSGTTGFAYAHIKQTA